MNNRLQNRNDSSIGEALQKAIPSLEAVLPKHITGERMARIALSSIRRNPALQRCTVQSLLSSVMQAAQLGIEIDDGTGRGYLIPYKSEATFQIGYKGIVDLAWRCGAIKNVNAEPVYAGDYLEIEKGFEPKLIHKPRIDGEENEEELTHVYATILLFNGEKRFKIWPIKRLKEHREQCIKYSRNKAASPWITSFAKMCEKTMVKQVLNMTPIGEDAGAAKLHQAINQDTESELGITSYQVEQVSAPAPELPAPSEADDYDLLVEQAEEIVEAEATDLGVHASSPPDDQMEIE